MDLTKYDGHNKVEWVKDGWKIKTIHDELIATITPWEVLGTRKEDVANLNLLLDAPKLLNLVKALSRENAELKQTIRNIGR